MKRQGCPGSNLVLFLFTTPFHFPCTVSLQSSLSPDIQRLWKAYPFERNPTSWVPPHPGYGGEFPPQSSSSFPSSSTLTHHWMLFFLFRTIRSISAWFLISLIHHDHHFLSPNAIFVFFSFHSSCQSIIVTGIEEVLLPAQYMTITRTLSPNPLIDFYFSNFYSLNGFIRIEFVQCRACYDAHPDTYSHNDNHYRSKMNETKWPDWNNVEKNRFCLFCGSNRSIKIIKFSKSSSNSSSNFSILKEIRMNKTFPIWPCFNDFL